MSWMPVIKGVMSQRWCNVLEASDQGGDVPAVV